MTRTAYDAYIAWYVVAVMEAGVNLTLAAQWEAMSFERTSHREVDLFDMDLIVPLRSQHSCVMGGILAVDIMTPSMPSTQSELSRLVGLGFRVKGAT